MKKIILILLSILFATNVYAHSTKGHTPNLDYSAQCTKKKSVLNFKPDCFLRIGTQNSSVAPGYTVDS